MEPNFIQELNMFQITDAYELRQALVCWKFGLTVGHLQLLGLLADGATNEDIAEAFNLAELRSAQDRVNKLLAALGLHDRRQLLVFAGWCGLGQQPWIAKITGQPGETTK